MMEKEPFLLAELEDLSAVFAPLKSTTRVKYTCFNVSANLLILGASSGGLYIFRREPCVFLQLIPSKEGAVSQIAISADERLVAVSTVRGTVNLVERTQKGARVVATSLEHHGVQVTALVWGGSELFAGDASGRVSVLARAVFQQPGFLLMQLDSKIVQLDAAGGLLLASTLTRSYVCDTERELYRQVGHKLRDGSFGGCFLSNDTTVSNQEQPATERTRGIFSDSEKQNLDYSHLDHLRAFCTRPGARIWEVDAEGTVLKTHHFRDAFAVPPRPIITDQSVENNNRCSDAPKRPDPVNFGRLFVVLTRYLLTYQEDAMYIVDPARSEVVLWNDQIRDIADIRVTGNVIYVWCASGRMHALNLVSLEKFLIRMYFWKKYQIVGDLCVQFNDYLMEQTSKSSKLHLLKDLDKKLEEGDSDSTALCAVLAPLIEAFSTNAHNNQVVNAQKLKSGIYQITRPACLNLKNRSHSVSPDRLEKAMHGSTSSLPELVQEDVEEEREEDEAVELDSKDVALVRETCQQILRDGHSRESTLRLLGIIVDLFGGLSAAHPIPFSSLFSKDEISVVSSSLRHALSTRCILQYLEEALYQDDASHPAYLSQNISPSHLLRDLKLSKVLRLFYWILDEYSVVSCIKALTPASYYYSLTQVISRFETNSMSLSDNMSSARTLSVALFLLRMGQTEQISRCKLDVVDVMYLTLRLEEQLQQAGKSEQVAIAQSRVAFLSYIERTARCLPKTITPFAIHCLESLESSKKCECGFPVPGSWRPSVRFPGVVDIVLEPAEADPAIGVRICSQVPSLWPQLLRLRSGDGLLTQLPLILHLNDLDELERRIAEMDALICEVCIRHLAGIRRGDCLNCGRTLPEDFKVSITWTQLGLLFVKAIGPSATLSLLQQYSADVKDLEPVFHQSVVLATVMEKHIQGLRNGVVDVLAGKAHRTSLVSPQFHDGSSTLPGPSHWGMRLSSRQTCTVCSLPLAARVFTEGGVLVFRCEHAYHAVCLRNREQCPTCEDNS